MVSHESWLMRCELNGLLCRPCGGLYFSSYQNLDLMQNPRGLMAFRKPWELVLEASSLLIFSLRRSAGFLFGILGSLLVVPRWRSWVTRYSTPLLLSCMLAISLMVLVKFLKLAETCKLLFSNINDFYCYNSSYHNKVWPLWMWCAGRNK